MPEPTQLQSAPEGVPGRDGDILAGTPYAARGRIGAGGMGTILEAEHRALGKRVVVKLLHPEYAKEPRLVERLEREARVLARVASPYLVAVTDLGQTADGSTYLVVERLHGRTLGRELKTRGALPVAEAIRWTRQILLGLAAAHRAGIIHRDVKPDNVFLCDATEQEPRRVKVLDFGIAKVLAGGAGVDGAGHQPTAEGTILGSPRWLAPEQALGLPVDARADVYAAGLILYSLLVGHSPFAHLRDPMDAMTASIQSVPRPPSACAPQHVPPALDDAIMMAIDKAPERRFQSAAAFARALESIAEALADTTQPLPTSFAGEQAAEERSSPADTSGDGTAPTVPRGGGSDRGRSLGVFLGVTAASAVLVTTLLGVAMHMLGGW